MNKLIFLLIWLISRQTLAQSFLQLRLEMQDKVKFLASNMSFHFTNRCNSSIAGCQIKSYHRCAGTAKKYCLTNYPTPDGCSAPGAYFANMTAVRFPLDVDINALNTQQKQFICTSALLEQIFRSIDSSNKGKYASAFFGAANGGFRSYPTTIDPTENGKCRQYDPRFRPWYSIGTSSGKNIVMIIDVSGSMESYNRMKIAIDAAQAVIKTLSNNDYIGVLKFSGTVQYLVTKQIARATTQRKNLLIGNISLLTPGGATNYEQAFRKGFQMLKLAQKDEYGSPCSNAQNIFLFLTDGAPTWGEITLNGLKTIIDSLNNDSDITLFTYAFASNDINLTVVRGLACAYKGISFQIPTTASPSQLLNKMRGYFTYLAQGITIPKPLWSEPYQDAIGFGQVVTVSMPAYYTEGGIRTILGVAAMNVKMSQLLKFNLSRTQIISQLVLSSPCLKSTLSQCDIENLRSVKCGISNCTNSASLNTSCATTPDVVFHQPVNKDTNICCFSQPVDPINPNSNVPIGIIIGCTIGGLIFILLIIGSTFYCLKYHSKKQQAGPAMSIRQGRRQNIYLDPSPSREDLNNYQNQSSLIAQIQPTKNP